MNEAKYNFLKAVPGQTRTAMGDMEDFALDEAGAPVGALPDRWAGLMGLHGFLEGSVQDRLYNFLVGLGYNQSSLQEKLLSFWENGQFSDLVPVSTAYVFTGYVEEGYVQ